MERSEFVIRALRMLVDQAHERERFLDEVMTASLSKVPTLFIYSAISQNKHKMEYEYNGTRLIGASQTLKRSVAD